MSIPWPPFLDLTTTFMEQRSRGTQGLSSQMGHGDMVVVPITPTLEWQDAYDRAKDAVDKVEEALRVFMNTVTNTATLVNDIGDNSGSSPAEQAAANVESCARSARSLLSQLRRTVAQITLHQARVVGDMQNTLIAQNAAQGLATRLQDYLSKFRISQGIYSGAVQRASDRVAASSLDVEEDMTPEQREMLASLLKNDSEIIQQREREIEAIARSVATISTMMDEIAEQVVSQGTLIDQIDTHMNEALSYVQKGNQHLERANAASRRTMRKIWVLYVVAVVDIILLILFLRKFS